jgi:hypothetical protein
MQDTIDTEARPIRLHGGFDAKDVHGNTWPVRELWINGDGFIADLQVELDKPGALAANLCEDAAFLASVFEALKSCGYAGPPFGRAEWGMQGDETVVLEPNIEFEDFAQTKGFKYLGE